MTKKKTILIVSTALVAALILIGLFQSKTSQITRPQEPSQPYSYYSEEVIFKNTEDHISLSGTLTLPSKNGNYPAVILISGSGPQNRDCEFAGHKPFLVISDYLTKNGIAVLRYDDRGFGKSTGDFKSAITSDFATDVTSAIEYLNSRSEINKNKIGLIGHSEGGIVAPMVAVTNDNVSFIVLLAGPGIEISKVILKQSELITRATGVSEIEIQKSVANTETLIQLVLTSDNNDNFKSDLAKLLEKTYDEGPPVWIPDELTREEYVATHTGLISSPWYKNLLQIDPTPILQKVTCPVLALNGEKDLQVSPNENLTGIKNALLKGGNMKVFVNQIPKLNHSFQESITGSPAEYEKIEQTFSPVALKEISDWVLEIVE